MPARGKCLPLHRCCCRRPRVPPVRAGLALRLTSLLSCVPRAQDAGLLISCKAHGAHHKAPFDGNYSIVSGLWNPLLDGDRPGGCAHGDQPQQCCNWIVSGLWNPLLDGDRPGGCAHGDQACGLWNPLLDGGRPGGRAHGDQALALMSHWGPGVGIGVAL